MNKKLSCVIIFFALHQTVWGGSHASSGERNIRLSILHILWDLRGNSISRSTSWWWDYDTKSLTVLTPCLAVSKDTAFVNVMQTDYLPTMSSFLAVGSQNCQQSNRQSRSFEVFIQSRPYRHNYLHWPAEVKFFSFKFDTTEFFLNS